MSKSDKQSNNSREANSGTWLLSYQSKRSKRIGDFRDFKEDCINTHESQVGAELGPILKLGKLVPLEVGDTPRAPLEKEYIDQDGVLDERAYADAATLFEKNKVMWLQTAKSVQHHTDECVRKHLPNLFVWIMSRLDHDLRSRVEQQSEYYNLSIAMPRDPPALMNLIENLMMKGDLDDEGFDNFELIRDLFASANVMKDSRSLADFSKIMRDKMLQVNSKTAYQCKTVDELGNDTIFYAFNEEFFVNLMFNNLSKKYETAKIEYSNAVSSGAITRINTFDALVKHFSSVRSTSTGDHVSATTLTSSAKNTKSKDGKRNKGKSKTSGSKDNKATKDKDKPKTERSRPCRHCNGEHWDNHCPTTSKKEVKAPDSNSGPTSEEIAKVVKHLKAEKAKKEAAALAASAAALCTQEEIDYALETYAASNSH